MLSVFEKINQYVEGNIGGFHTKRLDSLKTLKLTKLLKRKNPYLFKAKDIGLPQDLVRWILDAHLSSQEETIFGDFLEGLAIFVNEQVYGGRKSSTEGIDLEFERDGTRYIVAIKSGPNWGNSSQIMKMRQSFKTAAKVIRQRDIKQNVIAINGCCYGVDRKPDKGDYRKICGQEFWGFISGIPDLYIQIVEPLGLEAKERNEDFKGQYALVLQDFTNLFMNDFCDTSGHINWKKLIEFNSGSKTR